MKISKMIKISIALMVTLSITSLINLTLLFYSIKERTKATNIQVESQDLAHSFMTTSDFLTNTIRNYVQSSDQQYYDSYMKEVNETQTRQKVLDQLQILDVSDELIIILTQATEESNKLAQLESKAIEAVQQKDIEKAKQIVFGNEYNSQKSTTTASIQQFAEQTKTWAQEQANATYNKMVNFLISTIAFIIILVISMNASLIILHRKIQPLQLLTSLAHRVSQGDLTSEQIQLKSTKDEVGQLGQAFNAMIANLKTLVQKVKETSEQVAASSQELASSSEQSSYASEEISTTIQSLASGAEQQVHSVKDTSTVIEEIFSSSRQIAVSTEITLTTVNDASEKANAGNNAVQTSIEQMGLINQNVTELENVIKNMGEHSNEIGQIVEAITSIAEQTNLLALNAAIEAARAGESGRGFAVVADEVRKLAEMSSESTKQISSLIHIIQTDTNKAVNSMELTTKEVQSGIELVNVAGNSFIQINDAISEVTRQIQEVSGSVQQMAAGTEHVIHSMEIVRTVANEAAAGTQNVSASTEEQLASTEEITASANSLSKMADDLQHQIGIFKF